MKGLLLKATVSQPAHFTSVRSQSDTTLFISDKKKITQDEKNCSDLGSPSDDDLALVESSADFSSASLFLRPTH
jgi:hypothetical protein